MCILDKEKVLQKVMAKDLKEFILENYYKRIGFSKKDSYHSQGRVKKNDKRVKNIFKKAEVKNFLKHQQMFLTFGKLLKLRI